MQKKETKKQENIAFSLSFLKAMVSYVVVGDYLLLYCGSCRLRKTSRKERCVLVL